MRLPSPAYPIYEALTTHFPDLRPAQQRGLALWVYGTVLAKSACEAAVLTALVGAGLGGWQTLRQALRELLRDGPDKVAPCRTQLAVPACFAPLLAWLLSLWQGRELVLAVDATHHHDRLTALVVSVVYRSRALPVAWSLRPFHQSAADLDQLLALLSALQPAVPRRLRVLVLADAGLWSPRLYRHVRALGWHPLLRVQQDLRLYLGRRQPRRADQLVVGPGQAWVGRAVLHKDRARRLWATVAVVWERGYERPWVLVSDLPPRLLGVRWYALRYWIECGFRDLKALGWNWERTRRLEPTRVARHWLVLALASVWTVAAGTTVEDGVQGQPAPIARTGQRRVSVFQLGWSRLLASVTGLRPWPALRLVPERWPRPTAGLPITYHLARPTHWRFRYLPL